MFIYRPTIKFILQFLLFLQRLKEETIFIADRLEIMVDRQLVTFWSLSGHLANSWLNPWPRMYWLFTAHIWWPHCNVLKQRSRRVSGSAYLPCGPLTADICMNCRWTALLAAHTTNYMLAKCCSRQTTHWLLTASNRLDTKDRMAAGRWDLLKPWRDAVIDSLNPDRAAAVVHDKSVVESCATVAVF